MKEAVLPEQNLVQSCGLFLHLGRSCRWTSLNFEPKLLFFPRAGASAAIARVLSPPPHAHGGWAV